MVGGTTLMLHDVILTKCVREERGEGDFEFMRRLKITGITMIQTCKFYSDHSEGCEMRILPETESTSTPTVIPTPQASPTTSPSTLTLPTLSGMYAVI